ncbi:hypothetical protein BGZ63DRAFT_408664 [Mariannaea sp. PMI_226]|nr:hypothetical protein BGZ63DRAFT_408664 [Mariannaea sp. PMI_226]
MDLARILVDRLLLPNETESDSETSTLMAEVGITCLQLLSSTWSCNLDNAALLKLAAFTDPRDPWTTEEAAIVASHLLKTELDVEKLAAFIAGPVLQEFLKPLFAKSSSRVTESGRPDHYLLAAGSTQQHKKTSIWKTTFPSAIAVVRWAVEVSEISLLQQQWPLFTPVLLALVEDESAAVKTKGLDILASFARKCPPEVLHTTGIVRVFEDATFPILLYLPSLTPEDESVNLLRPAYKVLFALAETYHSPQNPERRRLLDKLLREGIFAAYSHSSQYARLVQTLMESMELAIKCLGIYSAKHLKIWAEHPFHYFGSYGRSICDSLSSRRSRYCQGVASHHQHLLA